MHACEGKQQLLMGFTTKSSAASCYVMLLCSVVVAALQLVKARFYSVVELALC
jgi:hypothetical protein